MPRLTLACLFLSFLLIGVWSNSSDLLTASQGGAREDSVNEKTLLVLKPARVFDGNKLQENWVVVIRGSKIDSAGPEREVQIPASARVIALPGCTLLPGLIDA